MFNSFSSSERVFAKFPLLVISPIDDVPSGCVIVMVHLSPGRGAL